MSDKNKSSKTLSNKANKIKATAASQQTTTKDTHKTPSTARKRVASSKKVANKMSGERPSTSPTAEDGKGTPTHTTTTNIVVDKGETSIKSSTAEDKVISPTY